MTESTKETLQRIIDVMSKLRDPVNGCPWDIEQNWHSLIAYTLEEAYEVADAIENNKDSLLDELGDLLFQVVFYAQIASEQNLFDLQQVIHRLCDKLEERHPHVFSDVHYDKEQLELEWHRVKAKERIAKQQLSALDDIPLALPALSRAQKLQRRASNEGFDWQSIPPVFDKLNEEITELQEAIENGSAEQIEEEVGDILFTAVNLARHLELDAETCLRKASTKFENRYRGLENKLRKKNLVVKDVDEQQLNELWNLIKHTL